MEACFESDLMDANGGLRVIRNRPSRPTKPHHRPAGIVHMTSERFGKTGERKDLFEDVVE